MTRLLGVFLVLGNWSCAAIGADTKEGLPQPSFNVGYQVLDLKYGKDGQEQTFTVAVWYPTAAQPKSHNYGGPTRGNVAVNAAPRALADFNYSADQSEEPPFNAPRFSSQCSTENLGL